MSRVVVLDRDLDQLVRDTRRPSAFRSAGISPTSNSAPSVSSFQMIAFMLTRSTMPAKSALDADRQLEHQRRRAQAVDDHVRRSAQKSAPMRSILLTKQMRGTPYLSAWRHTVSDCGSTPATLSNTATAPSSTRKRALDLDREVDVAGRVDDVDAVVVPEAGRRGRRDGDAALLLLLHPVHGGGAVMDFADLVGAAGVIEDALGRRRLAGIDVGHDADVAVAIERVSCGA